MAVLLDNSPLVLFEDKSQASGSLEAVHLTSHFCVQVHALPSHTLRDSDAWSGGAASHQALSIYTARRAAPEALSPCSLWSLRLRKDPGGPKVKFRHQCGVIVYLWLKRLIFQELSKQLK